MSNNRELVKTFIAENQAPIMGSITVSPPVVAAILNEMEHATQALAKANERIAALEAKENLTTLTTHEATLNSEYGKKWLDKFAMAQKIEALENAVNTLSLHGLGNTGAASDLMDDIALLRKEQDSE